MCIPTGLILAQVGDWLVNRMLPTCGWQLYQTP